MGAAGKMGLLGAIMVAAEKGGLIEPKNWTGKNGQAAKNPQGSPTPARNNDTSAASGAMLTEGGAGIDRNTPLGGGVAASPDRGMLGKNTLLGGA